jgi:Putative Actinobacterial Holin-X, holin superfamily III
MSTPYSGSTAGGQSSSTYPAHEQGYQDSAAGNYAVGPDSYGGAHSGELGTPVTDAGHPDVDGTSVGQLLGEVSKDLSTLMRQELDLAKAELKVEAKKAGQGAGMFGAAGFAGYMVLLFLSIALWWALENVMDAGLAALIVAVVWGVIGAVAFVVGRKKFQQVNPKPERTVETLQQVPGALKPQ